MLNPRRDHRPPDRRYIQTSSFAPKVKRPGTGPRLGIRTPRVPRGVMRMAGSANVESVPPPNFIACRPNERSVQPPRTPGPRSPS